MVEFGWNERYYRKKSAPFEKWGVDVSGLNKEIMYSVT